MAKPIVLRDRPEPLKPELGINLKTTDIVYARNYNFSRVNRNNMAFMEDSFVSGLFPPLDIHITREPLRPTTHRLSAKYTLEDVSWV
jgi:hypothetical protein